VFLYETRDVVIVEDMIHSVAAHIFSFDVSLMYSDLNYSCKWYSVF